MKNKTEPIKIEEDIMIPIHLLNGSFEANEEMIPMILRTATYFGLSSVGDLIKVTEEDFFEIFTPLMNGHYSLK